MIKSAKTITILILAAFFTSGCALIGLNKWSNSTIRYGNYNEVQRLIEDGANVNARIRLFFSKSTPLIVAASYGHTEIVKLLLDEGADVNAVTREKGIPPTDHDYGWTALMAASSNGHLEITRVLLEAGADVDVNSTSMKVTALTLAVREEHIEIIKLIIQAGADTKEYGGKTLSTASYFGHDAIAILLLKADTDVNFKDALGLTALMGSSARGYSEISRILLDAGANVNS